MMHIKRITTDVALSEIFKFRKEVLVEELGYVSNENQNLSDIYDNYAHNYAAYTSSGIIAGAIRVVYDNPLGLPLERLNPLNGIRGDKIIVEACRLAVAKPYRSTRTVIGLIAAAYSCAMEIGCSHMVLDTYLNEELIYERIGFKRISEPYPDPESKRDALVVSMIVEINENTIPLIENKAIQMALSSASKNIDHGKLEKERVVLEELSLY